MVISKTMSDEAKMIAAVIIVFVVAAAVAIVAPKVLTRQGATSTTTVTTTVTKTTTETVRVASTTTTAKTAAQATAQEQPSGVVYLKMGGATFPAPQYLAWIKEFMKEHPNIKLSYELLGSGAGIARFLDGTLDVAGSDPPLPHDLWAKHKGSIMQVPTLIGAVVVTYNLPGIGSKALNLSGKVLALIYLGKIAYWDDPRIQKLNPGIKLPHHEIFVVFRADASGTQQIFTTFLHKAAPDLWPESLVGKAPAFPVKKTGRAAGGKGNPGVAQLIKSNEYSIGFVEWSYAVENHLPIAALENAAGNFVKPSTESLVAAAASAAKHLPTTPLGDFSKDEDYIIYASGKDSYPLVAFTHLVLWTHYSRAKAEAIATYLKWVVNVGEKKTVPGYAPVPDSLKKLMLDAASIILKNSAG